MKAVVMKEFSLSKGLVLVELPVPKPQSWEVRIAVIASGFNPIDWKIRAGKFGGKTERVLGCECSGIVNAVGTDVKSFCVGDAVFALPFHRSSNGSYAEFVCLPETLVAKKPGGLSFEQAAVIPLATLTAYRATRSVSSCIDGANVLIAGAGGGVGGFVHQFVKMQKDVSVYSLARDAASRQFLEEKIGIQRERILIYGGLSESEIKQGLMGMTRGALFDATYDLVGGTTKNVCLDMTNYSGHFATTLPEHGPNPPAVWPYSSIPFGRNLSVHLVNIGAELDSDSRATWTVYQKQLKLIAELLEKKSLLPPHTTIVGSLSADTVQKAHDLLHAGRVKGKLVMSVNV
ncbi:MAG: putative oxidoreductase, Zn-binding protein [Parachlamydiales bacterium]|nr:putative oxidoreductase, Zn-binding protein [Parachlamydiales bacterium]